MSDTVNDSTEVTTDEQAVMLEEEKAPTKLREDGVRPSPSITNFSRPWTHFVHQIFVELRPRLTSILRAADARHE